MATIGKSDYIKILKGDVAHLRYVMEQKTWCSGIAVTIYPEHVRHMLNQFLEHKITADDLQQWARFITLNCLEFRHPGDTNDDAVADHYEEMWNVVERLSTPFLDGQITEERVKMYLAELSKYQD